jgi:succinyl-CoA synthetase alpha subunit
MVLAPVRAFIQSAFEKKSLCTLKLPQTVHKKGKTAIISQSATRAKETVVAIRLPGVA